MSQLQFWGKTFGAGNQSIKSPQTTYKPLLHHLLDISAVALVFLRDQPARLVREARLVSMEPNAYARLMAFLAGLHDLAKIHSLTDTSFDEAASSSTASNPVDLSQYSLSPCGGNNRRAQSEGLGMVVPSAHLIGASRKTQRLNFIDALPVTIVAFVIAHHAAMAYGPHRGYWPMHDNGAQSDWFLQLRDWAWLLFLLAGYFVPGSYDRKGAWHFLRGRWVRQGVPLACFLLVQLPMLYLLGSAVLGPALGSEPSLASGAR